MPKSWKLSGSLDMIRRPSTKFRLLFFYIVKVESLTRTVVVFWDCDSKIRLYKIVVESHFFNVPKSHVYKEVHWAHEIGVYKPPGFTIVCGMLEAPIV